MTQKGMPVGAFLTETYVEEADKNNENTRQLSDIRTVLSEDEKLKMFTDAMGKAVFQYFHENDGDAGAAT